MGPEVSADGSERDSDRLTGTLPPRSAGPTPTMVPAAPIGVSGTRGGGHLPIASASRRGARPVQPVGALARWLASGVGP